MTCLKEKADRIIETFYHSTHIGALCFDSDLNIAAYGPSKNIVNDFICLGIDRITAFIAEKYAVPAEGARYYTFFLESTLVTNLVFLSDGGRYLGVFAMQPVLTGKLSPSQMDGLLQKLPVGAHRNILRSILLKAPVVPYDRIVPMGRTLSALSRTFFEEEEPLQVVCGGPNKREGSQSGVGGLPQDPADKDGSMANRIPHSIYLHLKDSIQKGDIASLLEMLGKINAESTHSDQCRNSIRPLKNSFIKACALGCCAAVEAGAPYEKTDALCDGFIRQMEALENAGDVYDLMNDALVSFARAVAISRITSYSKPVRQALQYIEGHYAEKITLDILAVHTNLSATYLSNLIKKETGLTLLDNIGKTRMEHAKKLLLDTNMSSLDVARQVGFRYQNHFAKIFKKTVGLSPTEFKNSMGKKQKPDGSFPKELFPLATEHLLSLLRLFPGLYDAARIVDPISHKSRIIYPAGNRALQGACYEFWGRHEFCEDCIAITSYVQNRIFFKMDRQDEKIFLVLALPRTFGEHIYVIEVFKNITGSVCIRDGQKLLTVPPQNGGELRDRDGLTGLYGRRYVEKRLPVCIRQSRLGEKPFSILLSMVYRRDGEAEGPATAERDTILREYARRIADVSQKNRADLAGRYTGNLFLLAFSGAGPEDIRRIAEEIQQDFLDFLRSRDGGSRFTASYAIQALPQNTDDAGVLLRKALIALRARINGDAQPF